MAAEKLYKTKYTGVFYRVRKDNEKVFYIRYKRFRKSITEKVGTKSEGVTSAYASKVRSKYTSIERLKDDSPLFDRSIPFFDDIAQEYFESKKDKADIKTNIGRYNNHVKDKFGSLKLDEITSEMVIKYINKKRDSISKRTGKPFAPKTLNDMINLIGTIFNYAINVKDVRIVNPVGNSKIERSKVDNDRERYLDEDEIKKLIDILKNREGRDDVNERIMLFIKLSLSTGARLTSVLTITKADINLNHRTVLIKNHKSNRTYTGYLHDSLLPILEERMKGLSPIDYIISGTKQVSHRTAINKTLQPIFDKLFNDGLDSDDRKRRVVIHTLRHTFASLLAIHGTPIYTIKKLMDHSDINQTMRYAKLQPDSGFDAVSELRI